MNDSSINLLRNLCRSGPFPGKTMVDAIMQFQAHVPVMLAELAIAENKRLLAETAKDNAVAQVVMARAETQRLREELRSIRASVVRALGSEEPRRERPERRKDCGVRADNAKDNATFPAPPNDESTSSVRPSDP